MFKILRQIIVKEDFVQNNSIELFNIHIIYLIARLYFRRGKVEHSNETSDLHFEAIVTNYICYCLSNSKLKAKKDSTSFDRFEWSLDIGTVCATR